MAWRLAVGVGAVDAAVLTGLRQAPGEALARAAHPSEWVAAAGADRAVATLAAGLLWCVAAWVALALLLGIAARLPGVVGRGADAAAAVLVPAAFRRLLAGSVGLGVLLAPAGALAHAVPAHLGGRAQVSAARAPLPAPSWPLDETPAAGRPPLPGPGWPLSTADRPGTAAPSHHASPDPPGTPSADRPATGPSPGARPEIGTGSARLRVRPGDSLWLIAARRLAPGVSDTEIARAWPRWYRANRSVIGSDPALLRPGEQLRPPATPPAHEEASA